MTNRLTDMKKLLIFTLLAFSLSSCQDLFEPAPENIKDIDMMYSDPEFALGIIANAYQRLPFSRTTDSDIATDNAVTNNQSSGWLNIATGNWTASNSPFGDWSQRRQAILFTNLMLENVDLVEWYSGGEALNQMFKDRIRSECYAMRALQNYYLLRSYAGVSESGEYLGIPIIEYYEDVDSELNQPRATFVESIAAIISDVEKSLEFLPDQYDDVTSLDEVPQKYIDMGCTSFSQYNRAYGRTFRGRISGLAAKVIRAQAALLAASPAYSGAYASESAKVDYEDVVKYAGEIIDDNGGVAGISPTGHFWWIDDVDNIGAGVLPAEIIWRSGFSYDSTIEGYYFPPTLYGSGSVNPTQNYVDAFYDIDGYPIDHASSVYDASNPYENRDPRLLLNVVYNGSTQGVANTVITTAADGTNNDALNKESGLSTRTGYYLRKLTRSDVNPYSTTEVVQKHYNAYMRYSEMYLAYAEAANEVYGPTGSGEYGISAYDVIKALRARAGIGLTNGDAYLEEIKSDQDKMREAILNERRIELSFENDRFWDLRRLKADLTETATGMSITGSPATYDEIDVEVRAYKDYMNYAPIPYSELTKWSALVQNEGW